MTQVYTLDGENTLQMSKLQLAVSKLLSIENGPGRFAFLQAGPTYRNGERERYMVNKCTIISIHDITLIPQPTGRPVIGPISTMRAPLTNNIGMLKVNKCSHSGERPSVSSPQREHR